LIKRSNKLEAVAKPPARSESKTQTDKTAQHPYDVLDILSTGGTLRSSGIRWDFETTASNFFRKRFVFQNNFFSCFDADVFLTLDAYVSHIGQIGEIFNQNA